MRKTAREIRLYRNTILVVLSLVAFTALSVVPGASAAGVISANIAGHSEGGAGNIIAPAASAGAYPAINWNNVIGANTNSASGTNLIDSLGAATTLDVRVTGNRRSGFNNNSTPDRKLFSVNVGTGATSPTAPGALNAVISQIPYAQYDLYLYYTDYPDYRGGNANDETVPAFMLRNGVGGQEIDTWYGFDGMGINGSFYEFGTTNLPDALLRATNSDASNRQLSNYMVIPDLTASELEIIGWNARAGSMANETGLAGFQIVQQQVDETIPEPLTLALLGLAAGGLGGYVRRRRTA